MEEKDPCTGSNINFLSVLVRIADPILLGLRLIGFVSFKENSFSFVHLLILDNHLIGDSLLGSKFGFLQVSSWIGLKFMSFQVGVIPDLGRFELVRFNYFSGMDLR